jgi:hypothetical protein
MGSFFPVLILAIASQFGCSANNGIHNVTSKEMINKLKDQFHVVLMGEYVDESLVVSKNVLNWSLTDLVYVSEKENIDYAEIPSQIQVYSRIKKFFEKEFRIFSISVFFF